MRSTGTVVAVSADAARAAALAALVAATALVPAVVGPVAAADPGITVDYDGETVTVANGTSQVVTGTADVPVGTELNVRVRSTGDTQPRFIKTTSAVVTENGTWAAAFDFSRQSPDGTFSLTVLTENGTLSTEVEGEIVACEGDCADPTPAGTPTPRPEQTPTPTSTTEPAPDVELNEAIAVVDRTDVAVLELSFVDTDAATLSLGDETGAGYELNVTVRDADGDGRAIVYVDTALAGHEGRTVSTTEGDSVNVRSETSLESTLEAGEYGIAVYAGETTAGSPTQVGTMVVQPADDGGTTADPTPTDRPATSGGFGRSATTLVVSAVFVLGGAVVAFVLLR